MRCLASLLVHLRRMPAADGPGFQTDSVQGGAKSPSEEAFKKHRTQHANRRRVASRKIGQPSHPSKRKAQSGEEREG
ncbi:hypothetical protein DPX16_7918 [Anabarilius grahami]|uniref:Uncharacterized protein n=1 Tax=Anabarilius grahami TaxID=495550 RepID=A0A3N0Y8A8_ANAGA|nr:hypothetical protein DPX16_7918 [Anabarilius grahami]